MSQGPEFTGEKGIFYGRQSYDGKRSRAVTRGAMVRNSLKKREEAFHFAGRGTLDLVGKENLPQDCLGNNWKGDRAPFEGEREVAGCSDPIKESFAWQSSPEGG